MEIPSHIQVKLRQAAEVHPDIVEACVKQLSTPSARQLEEIGSYVGTMSNLFRSALNYATQGFCETVLKELLAPRTFESLNSDFPYSETRAGFDKKELVKLLSTHSKTVYEFLESVQPYYRGNEWLLNLIRISNIDKHVVINQVNMLNPVDVAFVGSKFEVSFLGDKLMASHADGSITVHTLPCFVKPYDMFATRDGKWALFLADVNNQKLGLMKFVSAIQEKVPRLISDFYTLC